MLGKEHIRAFQVHLIGEKKVAFGTLNIYTSALRFLCNVTLSKGWDVVAIQYAKTPKRLPTVLTQDEVLRLFAGIVNLKHCTIVMTTYAAGLRASEASRLRICDIDSRRWVYRRFKRCAVPSEFGISTRRSHRSRGLARPFFALS